MRHTVVKPRYTNMKNQSEIPWQSPAHPPPQGLRNYNVQAKRISFQIASLGNNPGQQLYHARAEQLGELGRPGCDEALSGMGGASLTNEVPGVM